MGDEGGEGKRGRRRGRRRGEGVGDKEVGRGNKKHTRKHIRALSIDTMYRGESGDDLAGDLTGDLTSRWGIAATGSCV